MYSVKTPNWEAHRQRMVAEQLRNRGICDPRVLEAMSHVPRHLFVPESVRTRSYQDRALPIDADQTISQPFMIAIMLQALALTGTEKVLEIGTGSGYQAALLGRLCREVHTVELVPELGSQAETLLSTLMVSNVNVHITDGSQGLPEYAPYDAIIVAASAPDIPPALIEQLAPEGTLLIPIGEFKRQELTQIHKAGTQIMRQTLTPCAFVPLRGAYGWPSI